MFGWGWRSRFRQAWLGERDLPFYVVCATLIVLVGVATLFRWGISTLRPDVMPFTPYFPVVIVMTLLAGRNVGMATAAIGATLGLAVRFGPPVGETVIATALALYLLAATIFIWGADHFRSIAARLREQKEKLAQEEDYRKLLVGELEHRLRNKLATIHAVLHQLLREQPSVWAMVDDRIRALGRTDEMIGKAEGHSLDVETLLKLELSPYGASRISFLGEYVLVPSKLAVTLALIFHEMATNAAKHGALASAGGTLHISWRKTGERLSVSWDETSNTIVRPPTREGFGKTLLDNALKGFNGQVFCDYLPSGLHCTITCTIPAGD